MRGIREGGPQKGDPRSASVTAWERNSGAVAVPTAHVRLVLPNDSYDDVEESDRVVPVD